MTEVADPAPTTAEALFACCLRLGDDRLVLGHRLSEWCGHTPILEEELALGNVALDLLGAASTILERAGLEEGRNRSADDLAFFREAVDYRNVLLVEQPNGDFAMTIVRQFLFDAFDAPLCDVIRGSSDPRLAAWASGSAKAARYHLRHSREWTLRLGGGTDESHRRTQTALDELWRFTAELFDTDAVDATLVEAGLAADPATIRDAWRAEVFPALADAGLTRPDDAQHMARGGRRGLHSEHLGYLLAEMQIVARSFPGAQW